MSNIEVTEQEKQQIQQMTHQAIENMIDPRPCNRSEIEKAYADLYDQILGRPLNRVTWVGSPKEVIKLIGKSEANKTFRGGPFDASWAIHGHIIIQVLGHKLQINQRNKRLADIYRRIAEGGFWWALENEVFATERPVIHFDERARFHNTEGPAVEFTDGTKLYWIEGIPVSPSVVEDPSSITFNQIRREHNLEVKRVLIMMYGIQRYLQDSGAECLDESPDSRLYRSDIGKFIICTDGSTGRTYQVQVPEQTQTCQEAQAFLYGIPYENLLVEQRT